MSDVKVSKFLSLVLRHDPGAAGLTLDAEGWVAVDDLLNATKLLEDRDHLNRIVAESEKKRFAFSDDCTLIRANQGHSLSVDLGLTPVTPPDTLYHGTATRFLDVIRAEGLRPMSRQYVHLSATRETATQVGSRHGKPVILSVDCKAAIANSQSFFQAKNGVWLTGPLAPDLLTFPA